MALIESLRYTVYYRSENEARTLRVGERSAVSELTAFEATLDWRFPPAYLECVTQLGRAHAEAFVLQDGKRYGPSLRERIPGARPVRPNRSQGAERWTRGLSFRIAACTCG